MGAVRQRYCVIGNDAVMCINCIVIPLHAAFVD